ncbi:hypothetical protein [Microbulbifer elongatus]|uniref:hypothetical protein n=1 Tax=Microbulbifer elongatus TaxID=86173 RepID=UPI001E2CC3A9|nr:hypothetical protein [Microbulbifer elongatus]
MTTNLDGGTNQTVVLKGIFPLPRFIRFIKERCPPRSFHDHALVEEWREARATVKILVQEESGTADLIDERELPEEMRSLADKVLQEPSMHRMVSMVPRRWCMVEIDRLVVFQDSINLHHVEKIKENLSSDPSAEEIIELASSSGKHSNPEIRCTQSDGGYMFSSASNDLRFLDVTMMDPNAIRDFTPIGSASHAIVVYVGFSDNVITATRSGNRIILTNGSHRVYALRELGFRYVPCLLIDATEGDVSDFLLPAAVKQDRAFYLESSRPPLFKDYIDKRLTTRVPVIRKTSVLKAKLDLQKSSVPAL